MQVLRVVNAFFFGVKAWYDKGRSVQKQNMKVGKQKQWRKVVGKQMIFKRNYENNAIIVRKNSFMHKAACTLLKLWGSSVLLVELSIQNKKFNFFKKRFLRSARVMKGVYTRIGRSADLQRKVEILYTVLISCTL